MAKEQNAWVTSSIDPTLSSFHTPTKHDIMSNPLNACTKDKAMRLLGPMT